MDAEWLHLQEVAPERRRCPATPDAWTKETDLHVRLCVLAEHSHWSVESSQYKPAKTWLHYTKTYCITTTRLVRTLRSHWSANSQLNQLLQSETWQIVQHSRLRPDVRLNPLSSCRLSACSKLQTNITSALALD